MSNLEEHAKYELERAGLFDKDSDYGGMLGESTMKLIKCFAEERHSGMSASMQIEIFVRLARFKNLSPITNSPDEWIEISESPDPLFQNKRDGSLFSTDGGKTGYSVNDEKREIKTFQSAKGEK